MGLENAYEVLSGAGTLYVADADTAMPEVDATPGASWTELGETEGGVTVTPGREIEELRTDQRTGPVKAISPEESLLIETALAQATLENLAKVMGGVTVTDNAAGASSVGNREMGLYRGSSVNEYALLFKADSPYGSSYKAQYWVPRGYFGGEQGMEYVKDDKVVIPVEFHALEDLDASSEAERFGKYRAQDDTTA
jgi:hypothetical protein